MKSKIALSLVVFLLLSLSSGTAFYFYTKYQTAQKLLTDPTAASKQEIETVNKSLSKFMELPDEEPTIATVLDKDKVKDQPFFAKAENGDKVVIYTKAGRAILYRPSTNKIIDIAPINLGASQNSVSLAVYNGTSKKGLAGEFKTAIEAQASNVKVITQANAQNLYEKSQVIDLTGNKAELAAEMAKLIGGEVATLPSGEKKPEAPEGKTLDLLVILGGNLQLVSPTPSATPSPSPSPTE